jgi:predicted PurR-regulated permease PerM
MTRSPDHEIARQHLWQIPAAREFLILVVMALFLWLLYELRGIFIPLLIALILAHIFNPLVTFLEEKWRWPRPLTAALLLAIFVFGFAGFLSWLGPLLLQQITDLVTRLPEYLRTLAITYDLDPGNILDQLEQSLRQLQLDLQQILAQIYKTTGHALGLVTTIFSTAAYLIFSVALVLIYFFLLSWHFNGALRSFGRYLPHSRRERISEILSRMDQAVGQFFRGRLVIAVLMGILLSVGWFLTGVPYWFFLGMLTGLLNIVPYLSIVGWPIAILLKYAETVTAAGGQSSSVLSIVLWPSAVYIAVQLLEGWLLTPWIQSGQTNLSAAMIIIVVFIGAGLAGILGMLLAIPVAACIKILLDEIVLPRARRWAGEH